MTGSSLAMACWIIAKPSAASLHVTTLRPAVWTKYDSGLSL